MRNLYPGILAMPQLFQKAKLFNQSPLVNGGYDKKTPPIDIRVIFRDETSAVKTEGGVLVRTRKKTIWSRKELPAGAFIWFENLVFRIVTDNDWGLQRGFFIYEIEKVIGDNGKPAYIPAAQLGGHDF